MSRTGENIYKRKDGRWEARYIHSYQEDGKAKYAYLYAQTYNEVKKKLQNAKSQCCVNNAKLPQETKEKYDFWLDEWLKFRQPRVKESTFIRYKNVINNHIKPYLGKYPIQKISTSLMEQFVVDLSYNGRIDKTGGLSPKSVNDILTIVKDTFWYAHSYDIQTICCFEHLTVKRENQEMRVLTLQEEKSLVSLLLTNMDRYKLGVFISLYTGIRIGELCALQWKDFSLDEQTLKISKTMQRLQKSDSNEVNKTHVIITEPKSHSAKRIIPLPDYLAEVVAQFETQPNNYLLSGSRSIYVEPRTMQNHFKQYVMQCGIDNANFHALRHTFATRCVEAGFEIKSLSEILGHSSVKITLDKYVHSTMEQKRLNMGKLKCNL